MTESNFVIASEAKQSSGQLGKRLRVAAISHRRVFVVVVGGARLCHLPRPGAARRGPEFSTARRRSRRAAAASVRDQRRPLAAAGAARGVDPRFLPSCSPTRTSASAPITASIRSRSRARPGSSSTHGRIVSGGSTLTMQVARLLEPRASAASRPSCARWCARSSSSARSARTRSSRSISASRPMAAISKASAPPRSPISARSRAGSRLGEAALLVALPQSPEARRPDRSAGRARAARDRVLDRARRHGLVPQAEIARAKAEPVPLRRGRCRCSRRMRPTRRSRRRRRAGASPHHRRATAEEPGGSRARAGARARAGCLGRHPGGRPRERRGARARRLGRLFRRAPRRPGRHDAGAALARLDAQAVHLWARLRGRLHPSGDADRRPPDALRQLRAGEFRPHLPGHGDGAPGAAALAQRAGGGGARQGRRQPVHRASRAGRRRAGAAEGRGAGTRHGAWRRRRDARPIW